MAKQFIVSISREFGSGGHDIGELLAQRLGVKLYDKNILDEIAQDKGVDMTGWDEFEERRRNPLFTRRVGNFSTSMEDIVAELQFEFLKEKAESGESFVVVGRCADTVLFGHPALIRIFISAKEDYKVKRVMEKFNMTEDEAFDEMMKRDRFRRRYHNYHSKTKWGDSRHYEMCIRGNIGVEDVTNILETYVRKFQEKPVGMY